MNNAITTGGTTGLANRHAAYLTPSRQPRNGHLRRRARVFLGALLAVGGALLLPSPVHAHAGVTTSNPANGAALAEAPRVVVVTFNESVETSAKRFQLLDAAGKIVTATWRTDNGGARHTLTPAKTLKTGAYAVRWSVTSEDGHVVTGAISFTVKSKDVVGPGTPVTLRGSRDTVTASLGSKKAGRMLFTAPRGNHTTVEFKHKLLGATIKYALTTGKATVVLPMKGAWTLTLVERSDTYTEIRRTGTVTLG